ncbi:hypothetical protein JNO42_25960 [Pseudomonas putida]|uniref:hypothetical protein n=1 Tax=Pseudomonas putida TaxID=303 RepID=UPI001EF8931D|nr:hypothetical protein [Pseudomonas putida]ULL04922.1 hypothetical protein JNO42_25960 [Pseudomonas putida]
MGFPTVIRPGTWIKGKPDLTGQVDTFQNYYLEACYALICFERTQVGDIEKRSAREIEEPMMKRDIIRALTNGEYMMAQSLEMEIEASKICQNKLLQQGRLPLAIERQADVIYAKSFLFALDGYAKMVKAMSKDLASEALANVYDDFTNHKFPNLVDIRNSAHHIEDRIRMKAPYGKDIEPKPYEGEGIFSGMKGVKI